MSRDIGVDFKKVFKKREIDPGHDILPEVTELIKSRLPIPDIMAEDMAEYVMEIEDPSRRMDVAVDLCNLFTDNLDPGNTVLELDDWIFVRDQTNASADDMDLDIVTRIMQMALDHGAFRD
jgi:hypothetical protein